MKPQNLPKRISKNIIWRFLFSTLLCTFAITFFHIPNASSTKTENFALPWQYLNYNETMTYLKTLKTNYPHLVTLESIGKSVQGRNLMVIRISTSNLKSDSTSASKSKVETPKSNSNMTEDLASALQYYLHNRTTLKPTVRLVGALHGDEALGAHLLLTLAEHLLTTFSSKTANPRINDLLEATDIELLPLMNPDGFEVATEGDCTGVRRRSLWNGRENAHKVDLEENFVSNFDDEGTGKGGKEQGKPEPETLAVMSWAVSNPSVVLSASIHTGSLVVSYPLDGESAITADDLLFRRLAANYVLEYANSSAFVKGCTPNEDFNDGTVIGNRWKVIHNSMADFTYLNTNSLELNLYLSCCKYPNASQLKNEWAANKESLLTFIESAHFGIKGLVVDGVTKSPVKGAKVTISSNSHSVTTSEKGEYWRLLLPGTYKVTVSAYGYLNTSKTVTIKASDNRSKTRYFEPALTLNFDLQSANHETEEAAEFPEFHTPTEFVHHNYIEMEKVLKGLAAKFPQISRLYSAGKSVEGRQLYVLEITDNPGVHEPLEPEFKYVANMHGNEVVGREVVLLMAKLLLENYGKDEKITTLVNNTRLHLMASMNPDGWERSTVGDCDSLVGRGNANGVDLNRNFPDQYRTYEENAIQEPETAAMMTWLRSYPFVLSANLHGGSLVANYPYDGNNRTDRADGYSATPDDTLFRHLATVYSENHPTMKLGECAEKCSKELNLLNEHFNGGIINGAQWYALYGGMQDWNYLHTNCYEITIEMGCRKYPAASELPKLWRQHRRPMLIFLDEVHKGVKGIVRDGLTNMSVPGVAITVNGSKHPVHSVAPYGDYWRLLLPGTFQVTATKVGYKPETKTITVIAGEKPVLLDFSLQREPASFASANSQNPLGQLFFTFLCLLVVFIVTLFVVVAFCPSASNQLQFYLTGSRRKGGSSYFGRLLSVVCCCGCCSLLKGSNGSSGSSVALTSSSSSSTKPVLESFHYTKLNASDAAPLFDSDLEDDDEDEEVLNFDVNSLLRK